jgi:CRP-like cAMP-binding protein
MTMHAKFARALLEVADCLGEETSSGKTLIPLVNQRDLAALAGVARENANRILADWERRSLVTRLAHSYEIDRIKLEREAT